MYSLQQDARRLTAKQDYNGALSLHKESLQLIACIYVDASEATKRPLRSFKAQIENEIDFVNNLKFKAGSNSNLLRAKSSGGSGKNTFVAMTTGSNKTTATGGNVHLGTDGDRERITRAKMLNYLTSQLSLSLQKNLNINVSKLPNQRQYKIATIDKDSITQLEHLVQLMNFSGSGETAGDVENELKLKNDYLSQLNGYYYTELKACQDCIGEFIRVLKDVEFEEAHEIDSDVVGTLQRRITQLTRERIQLEDQILELKEKWNGLVETSNSGSESKLGSTPTD